MDISVIQEKRDSLDAKFKELEARRQAHVDAAESCVREMLKAEGAWLALGELLPPSLEVIEGEGIEETAEEETKDEA